MKVLCDVHIARKVVRFFLAEGIESVHINDVLDSGTKRLIKINLGNISTKALITILGENLEKLKEHLAAEKCLIEISDDAILIFKKN